MPLSITALRAANASSQNGLPVLIVFGAECLRSAMQSPSHDALPCLIALGICSLVSIAGTLYTLGVSGSLGRKKPGRKRGAGSRRKK